MPEPWERDVSAALERRLSGLAGTPGLTHKILETGGKRKMKKKMILSVVLAALLILSTSTALAAGMKYSAQYSAIRAARAAVQEKYGLTDEMMQMLQPEYREEQGEKTVVFASPTGIASETGKKIGTYTVRFPAEGEAEAAWSHDGREADWQGKDLDEARVWAAPQLQMQLDAKAAQREREDAAFYSLNPGATPFPTHAPGFYVETEIYPENTPGAGYVTYEEALETVKLAALEEYPYLAGRSITLVGQYLQEEGCWRIELHGVYEMGEAKIDGKTGEVLYLNIDNGAFSNG